MTSNDETPPVELFARRQTARRGPVADFLRSLELNVPMQIPLELEEKYGNTFSTIVALVRKGSPEMRRRVLTTRRWNGHHWICWMGNRDDER
jgi:hypothetical protein